MSAVSSAQSPDLRTPKPLPLVFEAPRRGKPPRHWADLTPAERREAMEAAGHRAFRARQLSVHYFDGLRDDPADWTDLPAALRTELAATFMPRLLTPVHELSCDGDTTVKTPVAAARRRPGGERADALPRPGDHVRVQPGGLRHGLPVLCDRPRRAAAQHEHRRDRRAGDGRGAQARSRPDSGRTGSGQQRGLHGDGRAAGQLPGRDRGGTPAGHPRSGRARDECPGDHRLHRRPGAQDAAAGHRGPAGHVGVVPARAGRRAARRAGADQHPMERGRSGRRRLGRTRGPPSAASRSSTS